MKLNFVKVNPVENMTIFVLNQVSRSNHMTIANRLSNYNNLYGEQVGFIEAGVDKDLIRLQMMGGEFCGNATRSLAAYLVYTGHPSIEKKGDNYIVPLETSGVDGVIKCVVSKGEEQNILWSTIDMPLPLSITKVDIKYGKDIIKTIRVNFPGIIHFIVDDSKVEDREELYSIIKDMMSKEEYDAFGIMYYNYEKKFLTPLVYVRATDSLYWERSCGSGSSALGVALAYEKNQSLIESITQPGGNLEITVEIQDNIISNVKLKGLVDIVAEGTVYI